MQKEKNVQLKEELEAERQRNPVLERECEEVSAQTLRRFLSSNSFKYAA
jgi:hypothetical protein